MNPDQLETFIAGQTLHTPAPTQSPPAANLALEEWNKELKGAGEREISPPITAEKSEAPVQAPPTRPPVTSRAAITLRRSASDDPIQPPFDPAGPWVAVLDTDNHQVGVVRGSWSLGAIVHDYGGPELFETLGDRGLTAAGDATEAGPVMISRPPDSSSPVDEAGPPEEAAPAEPAIPEAPPEEQ